MELCVILRWYRINLIKRTKGSLYHKIGFHKYRLYKNEIKIYLQISFFFVILFCIIFRIKTTCVYLGYVYVCTNEQAHLIFLSSFIKSCLYHTDPLLSKNQQTYIYTQVLYSILTSFIWSNKTQQSAPSFHRYILFIDTQWLVFDNVFCEGVF